MRVVKWCLWLASVGIILVLSQRPAFAQIDEPLPNRGWLRGGLAWSPDSTMLAVGSSLGVWIYAVDTWEDVLFRGNQHYITSLAWSPDGKLLASGSWDFTVRLWDTVSGDIRYSLDIPQREDIGVFPSSIGWSPNGDRIVVNGITIWDVATGSMLQEWTDVDPTEIARWQPGGERIASSTFDGHIEIRDATNGDLLTRLGGHPQLVSTLAWSPDGQYLVSTGGFDREDSR